MKSKRPARAQGKNRADVVISVVATDSTFVPIIDCLSFIEDHALPRQSGWQGRCIHCNAHIYVTMAGETAGTLEHIHPLCDGGDSVDPRNLALACARCNNEKGIRHDRHVGAGGRADEVIAALQAKRHARWRSPN